jgi:hypothetical protein
MDTTIIRKELVDYIALANEEKIIAIYDLIIGSSTNDTKWFDDKGFVEELEKRSANLASGIDPGLSVEDSKQRIESLLK